MLVYLRKGRLLTSTSRKLRNKKYGLCKVLKEFNNNAYVIDLPKEMAISSMFKVVDIFEYVPLEELKLNLRMSSFQEGETDVEH